jgi:hypothetical protein
MPHHKLHLLSINFDDRTVATVETPVFNEFLKDRVRIDDDRTRVTAIRDTAQADDFGFIVLYTEMLTSMISKMQEPISDHHASTMLALGCVPIFAPPVGYDSYSSEIVRFLSANKIQYWKKPRFTLYGDSRRSGYDVWVSKMGIAPLLRCAPHEVRMLAALKEVLGRCGIEYSITATASIPGGV